jgi:NhaA family Na+:H+ antiporter
VIVAMNRAGILSMNPYFLVGALVWVAVLESGVHATITGVVLGLLAPARPHFSKAAFAESTDRLRERFGAATAQGDEETAEVTLGQMEELVVGTEAPLERLERLLQPWTSYAVIPVFALANAGIDLSGEAIRDAVSSPVTQGVMLGLVIGKPLGILTFSWLAVRLRICSLPTGITWTQMLGLGLAAGIGFTVSVFITGLAFTDASLVSEAKIGILSASLLAGLMGYACLRAAAPR